MKVIQKIQTTRTDKNGERTDQPVEMTWYSGDSLAQTIAAAAQAVAAAEDEDPNWTEVLEVRIVF